jgi:hypothetical protein
LREIPEGSAGFCARADYSLFESGITLESRVIKYGIVLDKDSTMCVTLSFYIAF